MHFKWKDLKKHKLELLIVLYADDNNEILL